MIATRLSLIIRFISACALSLTQTHTLAHEAHHFAFLTHSLLSHMHGIHACQNAPRRMRSHECSNRMVLVQRDETGANTSEGVEMKLRRSDTWLLLEPRECKEALLGWNFKGQGFQCHIEPSTSQPPRPQSPAP